MDVKSLIADLALHGVESFDGYGIKVSFYRKGDSDKQPSMPMTGLSAWLPTTAPEQAPPTQPQQPLDEQPAMAQSLEAELTYDKVLNWSASPDPSDPPTPLTGDDAPLTNQG